jgi:hypothetical protein
MTRPGSNPGRRGGKPAINRLSYGAALLSVTLTAVSTEGLYGNQLVMQLVEQYQEKFYYAF